MKRAVEQIDNFLGIPHIKWRFIKSPENGLSRYRGWWEGYKVIVLQDGIWGGQPVWIWTIFPPRKAESICSKYVPDWKSSHFKSAKEAQENAQQFLKERF